MSQTKATSTPPPPTTDAPSAPRPTVFAVHGAEPEVQAYAMAKYSRSALSMAESLREINDQKAEQFLNTFYFQYGHRSIADLAHLAFAIERLSLLAAVSLVDEQRWDGQERSTRYQNFRKSGYYVPPIADAAMEAAFREIASFLFAEYEAFSDAMWKYLASITPRPEEMKQDAYDRTLKARAFDISRYLLPLATNTSLGQIVNARTLETQVARLLSHTHAEVRQLGQLLKDAASQPAHNVSHESWSRLVEEIRALDAGLGERAAGELLKPVRVAPTLMKYANASQYEMATRSELQAAAAEMMRGAAIESAPLVDLLEDEPLEVELATTLLYQHCHYSYRQLRRAVEALPGARREEMIDLGLRHRGRHDEMLRPFCAGQAFRFDVLMDIGGFRDMHRHRRCIQVEQSFTTAHGYDTPPEITAGGLQERYRQAMARAAAGVQSLAQAGVAEAAESAQYLIPLAYRKRTLFKMDFAEVVYISELRTTAAGHQSYRDVAYAMYEQAAARYPALAKYFRVTDVRQPVDLLKR